MKFKISDFQRNSREIEINRGQALFVAGKNGSGKSTLILEWAKSRVEHPVLIGNREVSFKDSSVSMSASEMRNYLSYAHNNVRGADIRTIRSHHNDQMWLNTLVTRLDTFASECMRRENEAHRAGNTEDAEMEKERDPIFQINQIFNYIGLELSLSIEENSNYRVKNGSLPTTYGIDKMSDGERAALILISTVILAKTDEVITIDEPERHLHRSISSPLLRELFRRRQDLIWIVATHDVALLRDFADQKLLVLYGYDGNGWQFDLLESTQELPEGVIDAIYGAREKVLFVEGEDGRSLDRPLYQVLFPETTIISRGSCNEVQRSVTALNSVGKLNSMEARGLVDADNRMDSEELQKAKVAQLGVHSVESIYFHPSVVRAVARKLSKEPEVDALLAAACQAVPDAFLETCAQNRAESALRTFFRSNQPKLSKLREEAGRFQIDLADFNSIEVDLRNQMQTAKNASDWHKLVKLVKIKGTSAPAHIVKSLGLTRSGYNEQVRIAVATDMDVRKAVLELVPDPFSEGVVSDRL